MHLIAIAFDAEGNAWFGTQDGISVLSENPSLMRC